MIFERPQTRAQDTSRYHVEEIHCLGEKNVFAADAPAPEICSPVHDGFLRDQNGFAAKQSSRVKAAPGLP